MEQLNNQLQVFNNEEFGKIEILVDEKNKEWFPSTDMAKVLGYSNPHDAISKHCKENGVAFYEVIDNMGRTQKKKFINEGNLYRLITKSKLPSAEKFETWVFDAVLPTIRKTGGFISNADMMVNTYFGSLDENYKGLVKGLFLNIEEQQKKIAEKDETIKVLSPLAELAKKRIDKTGTVSLTDLTKTYSLKKGQISCWAKEQGYIHKSITEINNLGEEYFKIVDVNGFKGVGILEEGIKLIDNNIETIKTSATRYKKKENNNKINKN